MLTGNRKTCYCAFCKNTRKIYTSKHMNLMTIVGLVLLSYVITYSIWQQPDARGLYIMALLLFIGEAATQVRWRQKIVCQNCGFDPVLYVKNPEAAAVRVKEFMKLRSEKPEFLLKPALNLPTRRVIASSAERGQNLSLRG